MDVLALQTDDIETTSVERARLYRAFRSSPEGIWKRAVLDTVGRSTASLVPETRQFKLSLPGVLMGTTQRSFTDCSADTMLRDGAPEVRPVRHKVR